MLFSENASIAEKGRKFCLGRGKLIYSLCSLPYGVALYKSCGFHAPLYSLYSGLLQVLWLWSSLVGNLAARYGYMRYLCDLNL
ncbi:hypothetical protein Nepgr_026332 [Nepenthes gracilis]|uniref:Uncharacterized protein n=1 Tax=Nepenthes gracilis TaxID=150966 RepID=A0AAD3T899_NEPGR|nr:hypothetical protein Nepgr_026332 [Nepenthes gracilis]